MIFSPRQRFLCVALSSAFAAACASLGSTAHAQAAVPSTSQSFDVNVPAQPLSTALSELSRQTGAQVFAAGDVVTGINSRGASGRMTIEQALRRLLADSPLEAVQTQNGSFAIRRAAGRTSDSTLPAVTVTANSDVAGDLSPAYAGGQVARGGRVGLLGNRGVMDTPFNVTNYTSQLIENQQATSIADVLANDPSVRTTAYGLTTAGFGDSFVVRGSALRGDDIAFDGIVGITPARLFPVETAERVEILKGPNALLNGMALAGSLGGAINVVPKRAGEAPLTRLTTTYTSDGLLGGHVDVGRRFGEDNRWGVRVNGIYRNGDTAIDGQSVELGAATVGIDYRSDRLRATLDVGYLDTDTDSPTTTGFAVAAGLPVPGAPRLDRRFSQEWEFYKHKSDYLLARMEYDIAPDWTVHGAVGYRNGTTQTLTANTTILTAQGNARESVYYWPAWNDRKTVQAGIRGRVRTGPVQHDLSFNASSLSEESGWNAGYWAFTTVNTNIYAPTMVPAPSTAGFSPRAPKQQEISLPSLAIADTMSWMDGRMALTLGLRQQKVKLDTVNLATGVETRRYDESAVTPAVTFLLKPTDGLSLYANYIQGLTQGPTAPVGTTNAGEVFAPVKTKQVEAGAKFDLGSFTATTSIFQTTQPSGLNVPNGGLSLATYRLDGEQRNRGLEVNVFGELGHGVRLLGGVAYTDAKLTRTAGGTNDGRTAIGVPRWTANLGGEWDPGFAPGATFSARMISTSSQYLDAANARDIPGWTRWDIGARYTTKAFGRPTVLRAGIDNVFGRDYWAAATTAGWLIPGLPRTFTLSASIDF